MSPLAAIVEHRLFGERFIRFSSHTYFNSSALKLQATTSNAIKIITILI